MRSSARRVTSSLSLALGVAHADLVLGDVLLHDVVVELVRLLVGQVVVDLSTMRLNHIGFIGTGAVGQRVILSADTVLAELFLMFPAGVLHLHEASRG